MNLYEGKWIAYIKNTKVAIGCNFSAINYLDCIYIFGGQKREGGLRNLNSLHRLYINRNEINYDSINYSG